MTVCRGERLSTIWLALAANKYCSSRAQVPPTMTMTATATPAATASVQRQRRLALAHSPVPSFRLTLARILSHTHTQQHAAAAGTATHHRFRGLANDRLRFSYVHSVGSARALASGLLCSQSSAWLPRQHRGGAKASGERATPSLSVDCGARSAAFYTPQASTNTITHIHTHTHTYTHNHH